jgi:hypothetical protein
VKVKIMKNGANVWPATGYQSVGAAAVFTFTPVDVVVAAGDTLYFHVNQNGTTFCDSTKWIPTVTYR